MLHNQWCNTTSNNQILAQGQQSESKGKGLIDTIDQNIDQYFINLARMKDKVDLISI